MHFNIEISKITKISSAATIIGMLLAWIFSKGLILFIPIPVAFVLMFSYPGTEKVGIKGFAEYAQAGFVLVAIEFIAFAVSIV